MSYEHCDLHDQDATNGCLACEKEEVDAMDDRECVLHAADCIRASGMYSQPMVLAGRVRGIAETLDMSAAKEALGKIAKLCGAGDWEYPGQVVRDVELAVDLLRRLREWSKNEYQNSPKLDAEVDKFLGGVSVAVSRTADRETQPSSAPPDGASWKARAMSAESALRSIVGLIPYQHCTSCNAMSSNAVLALAKIAGT